MTYLLPSNYVNKQLILGLHKVEHGITKREATYLLLFLQSSMTWSLLNPPAPMILLQFCHDVVRSLFTYSLYEPCYYCPQSFLAFLLNTGGQQIRSQMNQPQHEARAHTLFKLQYKTLMYSHGYTTFSGEKQYTVMWQVLWISPSPERTRPYVETSDRKLRDVGFFLTSSKSKEEIKNSNGKEFLSSCFTF